MKAIWNGKTIAESEETILVEGNHYFPKDSVEAKYLVESERHSTCPWKGEASYYTLKDGEKENPDAAWYYPQPKEKAVAIQNHVAFWRGVEVVD